MSQPSWVLWLPSHSSVRLLTGGHITLGPCSLNTMVPHGSRIPQFCRFSTLWSHDPKIHSSVTLSHSSVALVLCGPVAP